MIPEVETLGAAARWFEAQGFRTSLSRTESLELLSVLAGPPPRAEGRIEVFRHAVSIAYESGAWVLRKDGEGQLVEEVHSATLQDAILAAVQALTRAAQAPRP